MSYKSLLRIVFAACLALSMCVAVEACPTCKEGLAQSDPHHDAMVQGYFWSILFMMSMPFVIFGSLATYFYLAVKKARRQQPISPALPVGLSSNPAS